jgi:hypothetical protein
VDVNRRHPFDHLGAWLLIVLGGLLLVAGATSFVRAALNSDWVELLVTAALMVLISFGIAHAVGQLRRDRSARSDPDGDESEPPSSPAD